MIWSIMLMAIIWSNQFLGPQRLTAFQLHKLHPLPVVQISWLEQRIEREHLDQVCPWKKNCIFGEKKSILVFSIFRKSVLLSFWYVYTCTLPGSLQEVGWHRSHNVRLSQIRIPEFPLDWRKSHSFFGNLHHGSSSPCILSTRPVYFGSESNVEKIWWKRSFYGIVWNGLPVQPDIWMDQIQQIQSGIQQNKPRWAEGSRGRKKRPVCIWKKQHVVLTI